MPSYVIHLAIGEEYLKKYPKEIQSREKFLTGIIEPDQLEDNRKAHYGHKNDLKSLIRFLEANHSKIKEDFMKGYFLHLYADYLMYSKYFPDVSLYDDYNKTNQYLIEKYHVKLPEKLSKYGKYKSGEPQYLTHQFLDQFINETINKSIKEIIKKVKGDYHEYKN